MRRSIALALICGLLPQAALAATASWSQTTVGGILNVGNQIMSGRPLTPSVAVPPQATVTRISWRISLLNPPPPGLEIKLCTQARCVKIDALAGQRALPENMRPGDTWRFIYSVNQRGQLRPPLNVVSQQLTVNYRLTSS
ncbi:flagellar protein FlhE [Jejubacter calystegiae]|uniref:Flagellar protein FlhE n=1 Tax=Jejubacter calystegiae TaxID=2579935 RepID=A0A4P8YEP5_9ENTR|nr:flagellar protein FlhE [Jejubacter calystegiae]QCT19021.1 flagellar protein FlhE [Jejubacter calystegiae]